MDEGRIRKQLERQQRIEEREREIQRIQQREREREEQRKKAHARMLEYERELPPKQRIFEQKERLQHERDCAEYIEEMIKKSRDAARISNAKRPKSRKRKGEFAERSKRIVYNDIGTAVAVTVILRQFRAAGMQIRLYRPVTQATSTMRLLLQALHTTPDQANAVAIKNLIQHHRQTSQWFRDQFGDLSFRPRQPSQFSRFPSQVSQMSRFPSQILILRNVARIRCVQCLNGK